MTGEQKILSVVAYLDNTDNIERFLKSIASNDCIESTEIIIVTEQDENSADVGQLKEYQKQYQQMKIYCGISGGISLCYNYGKNQAVGKWLHFTKCSSYYSDKAFDYLLANEDAANMICMTPFMLNGAGNKHIPYNMRAVNSGKINLNADMESINLNLDSFIVSKMLCNEASFNKTLTYDSEIDFILNLYLAESTIYCEPRSEVYLNYKAETAFTSYTPARDKAWYTDVINSSFIPLIERAENVPVFVQAAIYYLVFIRYENNYFDRDTGTLTRSEAFEFDEACKAVFRKLDDKVIFANCDVSYTVPKRFMMHSYRSKYGNEPPYHLGINGNEIFLENEQRSILLGKTFNQEISMQVINFIDGKLEFDFQFDDEYLRGSDYHLYAVVQSKGYSGEAILSDSGEKIELTETDVYSSHKYFGITMSRTKTCHLSISPKLLMGKKLVFAFEYQGTLYALDIKYIRAYSRLSESSHSYWMFDKNSMAKSTKRAIEFEKCDALSHLKHEIMFILYAILLDGKFNVKVKLYNAALRLTAIVTRRFYKHKHIWLTFDKLYKSGDNGEYMFRYCIEHGKGITPYYIISKSSADYQRLKQEFGKNILVHESFKQRLLAINCEMILATHPTVMRYCGFSNALQPIFKDLFKAPIMCIQHGLTIQKIAQYQNRVYDNTRLYSLASKYEWENICNPLYGYTEKELRLTGLARYDGLKSDDKRQILITPTWRRNVVTSGIAFVKKAHNDSFKQSAYYKIYNNLINDEKLIECAKRNRYRIIFLLHPAMSSQMDDYDKNDYVEIVQASGNMNYEKILTESSLMVTDYSGVQFDFAYQRKPVIYYHPTLLPAQYETGKLDFETMGFGPVCTEHKQVVDSICEYMEVQCRNPEKYIKRADDFFAYDDFENCRRIFEQAYAFIKNELEQNNNNINH
ncbi:MAG: CDP-glycerol glycerophosphotransferase family protein [Ruminococcus sp.]|nr:CDP-glycerol glycerophosphotransferase family protein [Ruminococcus sp.]